MITEGFIDGDLVERFLDFSQTQMEEVCRGLKVHVYCDFVGDNTVESRKYAPPVTAPSLTVKIE